MKNKIIGLLYKIVGWDNYIFIFTVFKIVTLRFDGRKKSFVHFTKLLPETSNTLIIGACTGITTIPIAKKTKKGKVFAFEPMPFNFNALNKVSRFFKLTNIIAFNTAVGNTSGEIEMTLPKIGGTFKHGMSHVADDSVVNYNEGKRFTAKLNRIDDYVELQNIKIDAVKLVAENFEKQILEGANNLILKNKPFI